VDGHELPHLLRLGKTVLLPCHAVVLRCYAAAALQRGGKETRKLIRQTEFYRPGEGPGCQPRFNVLVTSYEVGCA